MRVFTILGTLVALGASSPAPPSLNAGNPEALLAKRQAAGATYPAHTIDMPIDHFPHESRYAPHEKGTFKQRYFFDSSYYKPGGPVFLYIGGETSGESRFSNLRTGIIQILMQAFGGLGVILENRFYGHSYPFNTSTTDELRYLTTEQTIADNAYFAQHASFPGVNGTLNTPNTPWIIYGGSLAGAQTAFTMKTYNSVFAGGIGSSATAQAILAYPYWYNPIMKFGPADCISRLVGIVDKIDDVIRSGNQRAIQEVKEVFGLGALKNLGDFAMTIAFPIGGPMNYPTNTWQELNWNPAYSGEDFYDFCSNVTNPFPSENNYKVDTQLSKYSYGEPWTGLGSYADYVKKTLIPMCESGRIDSTDPGCFGTQNETYYADPTNGGARSYLYSTCTEQGAYQVAPAHGPSLISRVLQIPYTQQWCTWAFPAGKYNRIPPTPDLQAYNKYGGFNIQAPRLALIDGNVDVWLDLCYHSNLAPSPRISSDIHPSYLIAGGGHHWDSAGIKNVSAELDYIREAHLWEIRTVGRFIEMWTER
ncbi:peptidase S28 [Clohesyomyces aquaticus]|uniref:Peptidase S28 n=1 Tax=Clohesyomyces aquaticus TaxID=1231657 RepID=A0A1Y1YDD8_9PLEO|nr:peptidase S28 [Clohesyomyces aquaticus]